MKSRLALPVFEWPRRVTAMALGALMTTVTACANLPSTAAPIPTSTTRAEPASPAPTRAGLGIAAIGAMRQPRASHTASLLRDGRVLVVGGFDRGESGLRSAEFFEPAANRFAPAPDPVQGRQSHTASVLPDGRVLIVGGFDRGYLASSEIFDPVSGRFAPGPALSEARMGHVAVALDDGRVLIAGGVGEGWRFLSSAEVFDPAANRFARTGDMGSPRESHTATKLKDGRVLIAGGHVGRRADLKLLASAEIFDPATGRFSAAASMRTPRHKHDAVGLDDGGVLILGGADQRDADGQKVTMERFVPERNVFEPAPDMARPRYKFAGTSVRLSDGRVLMVSGGDGVELLDTRAPERKLIVEGLPQRLFAASALLQDGRVLVTGGYGGTVMASNQAWLVTP